ncbi:hypothetical protein F4678DRAFT_471985 [Xylaria arbuscula]|nr:hypothetical protein F4678DRAFT_471985 [Xylaria arbuscula]
MDPTDIWVICGIGTLMSLHYLHFLHTSSRASTTKTETVAWLFWIVYAGSFGVAMTVEGLIAMADSNPDMKLRVSVVLALYIAHVSIMRNYHTDNFAVNASRFLYHGIACTWVVVQAEYRWGICTKLVTFIS